MGMTHGRYDDGEGTDNYNICNDCEHKKLSETKFFKHVSNVIFFDKNNIMSPGVIEVVNKNNIIKNLKIRTCINNNITSYLAYDDSDGILYICKT